MKNVLRRAAVGATAVFAATAFAAPAFAAETTSDLELQIQGYTLASGVTEKDATFTIANHGPQAATDFGFVVDFSLLDHNKVAYDVTLGTCTPDNHKFDCMHPGPIEDGDTWDFSFTLKRKGAATGAAGKITVIIDHPGDENTANNKQTVDVTLSEKTGVDLLADAVDIWDADFEHSKDEGKPNFGTPVEPGAESRFYVFVFNQGTDVGHSLMMSVKLPEGVTFVGTEKDCDYTDGDTQTTCTYEAVPLGPWDGYFWFRVKVADNVVAPVVLGGGQVVITDVPPQGPSILSAAPATLPSNLLTGLDIIDVDPTDNSDEFSAHVGKKGGQGGGLPVTGAKTSLILGAGLGVIILGGALFLVTRRRRVTV